MSSVAPQLLSTRQRVYISAASTESSSIVGVSVLTDFLNRAQYNRNLLSKAISSTIEPLAAGRLDIVTLQPSIRFPLCDRFLKGNWDPVLMLLSVAPFNALRTRVTSKQTYKNPTTLCSLSLLNFHSHRNLLHEQHITWHFRTADTLSIILTFLEGRGAFVVGPSELVRRATKLQSWFCQKQLTLLWYLISHLYEFRLVLSTFDAVGYWECFRQRSGSEDRRPRSDSIGKRRWRAGYQRTVPPLPVDYLERSTMPSPYGTG